MARLVRSAIALEALIAEARRDECGAIATFLGTTRNHHDGRVVTSLAYEAYESMALERLERIERDAESRFGVERCLVVHRLGEVPVGEASVAVVVAARHRAAAFEACRWSMDTLKAGVPIWKKESYAGGGADWVAGTPLRS